MLSDQFLCASYIYAKLQKQQKNTIFVPVHAFLRLPNPGWHVCHQACAPAFPLVFSLAACKSDTSFHVQVGQLKKTRPGPGSCACGRLNIDASMHRAVPQIVPPPPPSPTGGRHRLSHTGHALLPWGSAASVSH